MVKDEGYVKEDNGYVEKEEEGRGEEGRGW